MSLLRRYVWQGIAQPSMEYLTLTPRDEGGQVRSAVVGLWTGQPYSVSYTVEYNLLGEVARLAWDTGNLVSHEPGWWLDESGAERPEFQACRTVDIRQTPFTNTLAVLYAELGSGMSLEFPVIALDLITNEAAVVTQRYTCLAWSPSGARYRFQEGAFEAEIVVDADRMVIDYPGLYRRLYP